MPQIQPEIEKAERSIEKLKELMDKQLKMLMEMQELQSRQNSESEALRAAKQSLHSEIAKKRQTVAQLQRLLEAEQRRLARLKMALRQGQGRPTA